ncbi:VOC family protein [Mycetocola spongiae]|uniref:VOC family protein n=1 Tax=Mycetocola spongiae TaxID=2859226 RepID=UPI001CF46002|nr:VOC family protein [Mycetocola spongiae]UCR89332.1 glyoxalase [Mycetocola spongiae]
MMIPSPTPARDAQVPDSGFGLGLQHVLLAMPRGREDEARAFFRDLLGMTEVRKPTVLVPRGGVWFRADALEIHLGVEDPFRPSRRARPGITVNDLDLLAIRLADAGHEVEMDEFFPPYRRLITADPFGNLLEFLTPRGNAG